MSDAANLAARFETGITAAVRGERRKAIAALSKQQPAAYTAWIGQLIGGVPKTAEGFDQACAKLQDAGLGKGQAIMESAGALPAAHQAWLTRFNSDGEWLARRDAKLARQRGSQT